MSIGSIEGDVSHVSRVWGGYDSEVRYELQQPVFLWRTKDEIAGVMAVPTDPKDRSSEAAPLPDGIPTLQQYQQSPAAWNDVLGVVAAGTHIQCSRIFKQGVWPHESHLIYYAVIRDGPYEDLEIDINPLSHIYNCECTPNTLKPNPELLKANQYP